MDFRFPTSGLYTGGTVVADTSPLVQLQHQYNMKQAARDEALDDYFRNLNQSINPKGVRNQDIEGLTLKQDEWQKFYLQNKQAIKNPRIDGGKALTEYQGRFNDMRNYIEKSKNAAAIAEYLAKAKLNPNLGYMFEDDEIITRIADHDKPLLDPTHKTVNIQELSIQPKPLDAKELQAMQKNALLGLKPSEEVGSIEVDKNTLDTITTINKKYSDQDLQTVGNRFKSLYQLDRRVRSHVDKNLLNAPNAEELNEVYKRTYGKNAETPADLFAAQGILNAQSEGSYQKRTPGSLEQRKFMERLKQQNREGLVNLRRQYKQMDKAEEGLWLDKYIGEVMSEAERYPKQKYKYANGVEVEEVQIPVDGLSAKVLSRQGVEPDAIRVTNDGRIRPIFYQYYPKDHKKAGQPIKEGDNYAVDMVLSQPITMEQFKLNLSKQTQTAKQRAAEMGADKGKAGDEKTTIKAEDIKSKYKLDY
jgi:hypothetical protein